MERDEQTGAGADARDSGAVADLIRQAAEGNPLVSEASPEDVAAALVALSERIAALENEHKRSLAELVNSQRRAEIRERESRQQTIKSVVSAFIGVIDHFDLAMGQDASNVTAQQIMGGVKVIKSEFIRILGQFGVQPIEPSPGDAFLPGRHEAVAQVPAAGVEAGTIARLFQAGYSLQDWVVRPAKVAVATAPA